MVNSSPTQSLRPWTVEHIKNLWVFRKIKRFAEPLAIKGVENVAKRKQRYIAHKKAKRRHDCSPRVIDRHHIFYQRRHWGKTGLSQLRNFHYCIVPIYRNTLHRQIHEFIGDIPAPRECIAQEALRQLHLLEKHGAISDEDSIEKRLVVLIALFDCAEPSTAAALKRQLEIAHKFYGKPP